MRIYSDGYTIIKNPSPKGGGYTVMDEDRKVLETKEIKKKDFTCNEAELLGVLAAARLASWGDTLITDSMNTLAWAKRGKSKARPDLNSVCKELKFLIQVKGLNLIWLRREENLAGIYNETYSVDFRNSYNPLF